jgi:DNA-binding response OmpR family regulator
MRVLVLEDNQELGRLFCKVLRKANIECDLANDIETAQNHLEFNHYDALLSDLCIGSENTIPFLKRQIERLRRANTRVIIISGRPEYMSDCEALGVDRFVVKPIMSEMLRGIVTEVLCAPIKTARPAEHRLQAS